ncbi:maleylpyruvate isomerase family mycothiol-dependent enzyme [Amycolatopsis roodepoortensis]|uniref:maleylpyruvate isomerase family mycothiol-dependent enzyme n=1 Tax=Amycolatopsis roodepoortensis TaxID=700274 RepID=UPI00214BD787|nr:maleylpyruvate isomerase family mycothiol-dependent enzyme [Amycolatopsis roodepoortensis]UUV30751.1 maleylpyruvate isomerase family mycothiol-dependent enzyme [Amycolatopsis roodepoortensis]
MTGKRPAPDRDAIWRVIAAQRTSLADLLDDLSDDQWRHPSLCAGWTVRDVAAHLTLQQLGLRDLIATMAHWRGSMDRTIEDAARRRAAELSTARITAEIRATAGSRRHTLGVTYLETLADILVHGQDIAIPLGLRHEMPPDAAAVAADRVLSMRWPPPLPSARKMAGFRLTATDISWSTGTGPEVRGPMSALLLVCAGRLAALPRLSGDGAGDLAARLSGSASAT